MVTGQLHVVLAMDTCLLTSAIQQCLASNQGLAVDVDPPGAHPTGPGEPWRANAPRTIQIELLEDPIRFALQADGRAWILEYQGMDELARLLADLEHADAMEIR